MMLTFVLCQFITHCRYSEIRTRLYNSQAKRRLHTRHLRNRTSLHNSISLHKQKSLIPIKFPFSYSPMIFPPHAFYLALVRVVKNKKIQEKFSCLVICLSVTMVVRLLRNCETQILNFISCSDWFRRVIISTEPIRAADEIQDLGRPIPCPQETLLFSRSGWLDGTCQNLGFSLHFTHLKFCHL